jgi:glycosyl transferase family 2
MIGLVMIVRDEAEMIVRCLASVKPLISHWTIVDTGSNDDTPKLAKSLLEGVPGELFFREFQDFGANRTEALELASGSAEWLLMLDADTTVWAHPGLLEWLQEDPDPETAAWMIEIRDSGTSWRLPLLMRGDLEWRYIGPVHEYLDTSQVKRRPLLGLVVEHHGSSRHPIEKFDQYLTLLKPGVKAGDPRAVFYSAECLRFLGCIPEAIKLYRQRSQMTGFEEEAWYAAYQAAKLERNVTALYEAWSRRPWRPEPLQAAADLIREQTHDDVLFLEAR